jgi:alanine racemase
VELVRSQITIDLGALRRNVRRLREAAAPAELWAVVKADAYGHGAADVAPAALDAGAAALCVATVAEGAALRPLLPDARILVMGPLAPGDESAARAASLEVAISTPHVPEGLRVHAKLDTGMGRWGMSAGEARTIPRERLAGVMTHLATADAADQRFVREQLARFAELTASLDGVPRHLANSAATLRFPEARLDSVRCGIALYGLSPFGDDPARYRLEPVLSWRSYVALVKTLGPGESTGYGRRFVADSPTRIGLVPVGYADGWRRGLTGTEVLVAGSRRRVVGAISMDAFAVELGDEPVGAPVTLVGDGVTIEEHARVLRTINYELACGVVSSAGRAERMVISG